LATLVATAERELAETIPEAARALRQAIQVAAAAGDARPALQFLSQFPIATPEGSRRLLEAPQSTRAANHTGVQVLVGVQLDGDGRVVRASRVIHGSGDK
jgi:hypothetical protein